MAADLRRFLDERPILARRPSLIERIRKWMRRHPSLVGAALLLLVFIVVGLSSPTALVAREQARTQAAYERERLRAEVTEERLRVARRAADLRAEPGAGCVLPAGDLRATVSAVPRRRSRRI